MQNAEGLARPPIDAEELAAFIDGRLDGERRRRVIERLGEDEEAYELYSAVIEVREALAAEAADGPVSQVPPVAEGGVVTPFSPTASAPPDPGRRRRSRWLSGWWRSDRSGLGWLPASAAIAAGTAVAVFATWWVLRPTGSGQLLAAFDDGTVSPQVARTTLERLEPAYRGEIEENAAIFKAGVRAFDLALAVEAGDPDSTLRWLDEMARLLGQMPWGSEELRNGYQRLARRLEGGESLRSLRREIAEAEMELEPHLESSELPPLFSFGRWIEAVRTAAANGDRRFLASRAARRPLRSFLESSPSAMVASKLETLGAALGPAAASADLAAVARDARAIIEHCADGKPCLGDPRL
jgi:hypothetical protein